MNLRAGSRDLVAEATNAQSHVLVVDSDSRDRALVSEYLAQNDFRVTAVASGKEMLEIVGREATDLLLLDRGLKGEDGMQLAQNLRQISRIPIVMFTGRSDEVDRIMCLELCADDCMTKPFSPRELLARIRAVLRRANTEVAVPGRYNTLRAYRFCGWELNLPLYRLTAPSGVRVCISHGEFSLLCALLSAPQRILTRDELLELSRVHSTQVYDRSVDVQILRLRRKIEADPTHPTLIRTERGVGYYFDAPVKAMR
jgi:two-component system OmpR family response regulator